MGPTAEGMARDIQSVLIPPEALAARVRELAVAITADYQDKDLVLVSVLKGAFVFLADLCRHIPLPLRVDLMAMSTYGDGTEPGQQVCLLKDLDDDIAGRHVLIVEDIIDTGVTLGHVLDLLRPRAPASLRVVVLLDKPARRLRDLPIAYRGFEVPDTFVVGYGLDHRQRYRNLPYVATLTADALAR